MQHKLETRHPLLDENGHLIEAGWANAAILDYNPEMVKRGGMDLKEWEYYLVMNESYACGLSLVGAGPGRQGNVHFMDFRKGKSVCVTDAFMADESTYTMPKSVFQDLHYHTDTMDIKYAYQGKRCHIEVFVKDFDEGKDFTATFDADLPKQDLAVIVVPYDDPELFYYNCKANCLPAQGQMQLGDERYPFVQKNSLATYDWGRGIWEPVNQWYWGSASTILDGIPFGFNIGHGFGNEGHATENMIFHDGKCHKLNDVIFHIPGDVIGDLNLVLPDENYMQPWTFASDDGRLDMTFTPVMDRSSLIVPGEYFAGQHQVFGHFNGKAVLDDGREIPFTDLFGFAEKVGNVWG